MPVQYARAYVGSANIASLQLGIWRLHQKNPDINGDGKVNMADIGAVARAFGSFPSVPKWNTLDDINDDRKIDMKRARPR